MTTGVIDLRLSDFRNTDDSSTFEAREAELRELAAEIGVTDVVVVIENDVRADGKLRSASAFKTPRKVRTECGAIIRRTNRPQFTRILLMLQNRQAQVYIAGDESRISRDWRDASDLLDIVAASGASVVVPGPDGSPRWILTNGGTRAERSAFLDKVNQSRQFSEELSAKITRGRKRWAGRSWHGGPRPFGYTPDPATTEHHRRLLVVDAEAEVIVSAYADILDRNISLKAVARELREHGVATVTGAAWTASVLRDILTKRALYGLTDDKGSVVIPEIVPRDRYDRLVSLVSDPGRRTNSGTANEPKWLVSGYAKCGACDDGTTVNVGGGKNRVPAYRCSENNHLRRNAASVDKLVGDYAVARLSRPDAADLLRPVARPGTDVAALRAELSKLSERKSAMARAFALDGDERALESGLTVIRGRIAAIESRLADSDESDPLPEFRVDVPARQVWESLSMPRKRAVVRTLMKVTILPVTKRGRGFDPDSVKVEPIV
jgi:DNA invertase Pin-like site-specific DNA recombinase